MTTTNGQRLALSPRVPMLPSDALFWHAEQAMPEIRPYIGSLLMLDRPLDRARFRASLQWLTACVPRLRQRVAAASIFGLPEWEDDPQFALDQHVHEMTLPLPGSQRNLLDCAGRILVAPLDRLRPLWEAYVISGLRGGAAACLFKLHHSIVDGVGSVAFFDMLTQAERRNSSPVARRLPPRRKPAPAGSTPVTTRVRDTATDLGSIFGGIRHAVNDPLRAAREISHAVGTVSSMLLELNGRAINDTLADSCGGIGRRLDVVPLSMPRVQGIKDVLGVSLNDLVLAVVAGAIGRYRVQCGIPIEKLECVVPMNLRLTHEHALPGNRIGVFVVPLPVSEPDAMRRLNMIRSQTTSAKSSGGGSASRFLLQALPFIPGVALRAASEALRGKIGLICTNVPGPPTSRYLAGAKVDAIYPFLPAMFGIPITVALLSYGDSYAVGIGTHTAAITRPHLLTRFVGEALDEIERIALPMSDHIASFEPHPSLQGASPA